MSEVVTAKTKFTNNRTFFLICLECTADLSQVSFVIILQLRFQFLFTKETYKLKCFVLNTPVYTCLLWCILWIETEISTAKFLQKADVNRILFMLFSSNWQVLNQKYCFIFSSPFDLFYQKPWTNFSFSSEMV